MKGHGLGTALTKDVLAYAGKRGVQTAWGDVAADNIVMLRLADDFRAVVKRHASDPGLVQIEFDLTSGALALDRQD